MAAFSTTGIMLRKVEYGDTDLIISLLTSDRGKLSVIAKSAKVSRKRFQGVLQLFSLIDLVCSTGRRQGLPVLQEASLKQPFPGIGTDIVKTAYANYWAELINIWLEEGEAQKPLFDLFLHALARLDAETGTGGALSILFQVRFLSLSGLSPNLSQCGVCGTILDQMSPDRVRFCTGKGGLVCSRCPAPPGKLMTLSKGTVKQLLWVQGGDLKQAGRIRFDLRAMDEGLALLENFVPYHLGRDIRSLKFLRQLRR